MSNEPVFEVHWPLAPVHSMEVDEVSVQLATGPVELRGKRVAFISFDAFRREYMFEILQRELTASFDGLELLSYEEFGDIHGPEEPEVIAALPERLQSLRVDAAIVGTGA